nr:hypothetical protein Iba_chr08bCG6290 [Ipomoea batatas]
MWGVMIRYYMDYNPIFPLIFMGAAAIKAHTHSGSKFQYVTSTTMSEQILEVTIAYGSDVPFRLAAMRFLAASSSTF